MRTDRDGNPIINQFSEDGFVDLCFKIEELADDGRHYHFHLSASYRNAVLGMNVQLAMGIQGGFNAKMQLRKREVHRDGVRFLRSGVESDRLVGVLAGLYGSKRKSRKMIDEESYTAIALHQGQLNWDHDPVKLKIFGRDAEPLDEEAYYESFFNVDLAGGFVYWNEKDPDYRKPLLRALSGVA